MLINASQLMLYRNFRYQALFNNIVWLINNYNKPFNECCSPRLNGSSPERVIKETLYSSVNGLVEFASQYGFDGNLWHCLLTYILINNENAFSKMCEINGPISGTLKNVAQSDFCIFKELYSFDLSLIENTADSNCIKHVISYVGPDKPITALYPAFKKAFDTLNYSLQAAVDDNVFYNSITSFYKEFGAGIFGMYKAFKVSSHNGSVEIVPITSTEDIHLSDLVGYEHQKRELLKNTHDFIQGSKANNVLLYGDSGTGKSSSIKAILNEYSRHGLRMIEVYKHQFGCLPEIIEQIRDRNYKFIIYMDDLSFEDYETEYKYLKAVIEGGLEAKPDNVLLYATSNRRHLIREKWSDKDDRDDDLHTNDTVQEKLSLAARFGLSILYISPNKKEFDDIVKVLAEKHNISIPEEELLLEANKWELRHGGLSGRTAQHFITYLAGNK